MTPKLFSELGLSAEILKAIDKLGFEQAAPIQAESIPPLLQGSDVVGQSQTGSGKTAAFAIPAIEKTDPTQRAVQVLILCPTRELAVQVSEEVHKLALFKRGINALPIYGGQSYERQFYGLKQGAQIVIGTPGRLMDHMRRGTLRLETVKMVILDEVDVMLNMGFRDDIELILQATPKERQTVFFSATIPKPIQQLIEKYSRNPKQIRIEQKALTVPTVEQVYYEVDRRYKIDLLTRLIDIYDLKLGIIFCNTKRMVDDLVDHLEAAGYMADRLHGDMNQAQRDRVMNKFRKSGLEFLVATDIAARGIDVDDVQVVFNYDLPYDVEDYVHRIGRTGRAGRSGRAISFVAGREVFQIYNIERYTKMKIQRGKPPTVDEVEDARANVLLDKVRATLLAKEFGPQERMVERLLEEGFTSTDIAAALLHQLQGGENAPAKRPRREDEPERPARERGDDRRERFSDQRERRPRFEDRPTERRGQGNGGHEFSKNTEGKARHSVRAVPFTPPSGARGAARPTPPKVDEGSKHEKPSVEKIETPQVAIQEKAPEKTYSDEEILASVKPPAKVETKSTPKPSRRTPDGQTRLWMNVGEEMGIAPIDVVNAVAGETGLPGKVVGTVDVRERHLFADVSSEHVKGIIAKLNRAEIKGRKLKVKVA